MSWELTKQLFEKQLNRFRFLFFSSPCLLSFSPSLSHFLFFPCISPSIFLYCVCTINKRLSWDLYLLIIHTHHTHCFRREIYTYTCIHVFVFFSIFFFTVALNQTMYHCDKLIVFLATKFYLI